VQKKRGIKKVTTKIPKDFLKGKEERKALFSEHIRSKNRGIAIKERCRVKLSSKENVIIIKDKVIRRINFMILER